MSVAHLARRVGFLAIAVFVLVQPPAKAQADPGKPAPYASMNRNAVYYAGTGAGPSHDIRANRVAIGLILPLNGPLAAQGKELLEAAQTALDEELKTPLPDGQRLALAVRDESGPWGQASDQIVRLIFQDDAEAIITSPEGTIAHQAEQIANKIGVPIVTLSSDATTTQINMPWIFRMGPSDEDEALLFAREIYGKRGLRKVLLIAQTDHDGRLGADEFEKAARKAGWALPTRVNVSIAPDDTEPLAPAIKKLNPNAIVLWTDHELAIKLISDIRKIASKTPIYVCRKAAEFSAIGTPEDVSILPAKRQGETSEIWASRSPAEGAPIQRSFEREFVARTGREPTEADAAAYNAVRVIAAALRHAGSNRVRVRDVLASGGIVRGISFDSAGNEHGNIFLVPLDGADRFFSH